VKRGGGLNKTKSQLTEKNHQKSKLAYSNTMRASIKPNRSKQTIDDGNG
jgi:hypothetical protein